MRELIIVGTGCAGLTAAIYAARANLNPLVLEGSEPGGQLTTTTLVENFPGFPEGIDGPQLIANMHRQAEKLGAEFRYAKVQGFEARDRYYSLDVDEEWIDARSVIIASGASPKWLGIENEPKLKGHGLTSCATCDGAFYRNLPVGVVGGGDTATEEAISLTRFASEVFLIHRRDALRATRIIADRALGHPKIKPIWNTVVTRYIPDSLGEMEAVELRNVETGEYSKLGVKCVFVAIGHTPNTAPFKGKIQMDSNGYLVKKRGTQTSLPGVFAAGDVADPFYRQAVTAAGEGCVAAMEAERYLINSTMKTPKFRKNGERHHVDQAI
jgi:thioredoxin reductase (NADPH)